MGDVDQNDVRYDVCLSFAGADRGYVKRVVKELRALDVTYFYDFDRHTEVELWGKNLVQHLDQVYRVQALCCVVFASKAYLAALWPNQELRSAQARAFTEAREYLLLARFDDTEIPGLLAVDGYVDLRKKTPKQLAVMIAMKVTRLRQAAGAQPVPPTSERRRGRWSWPVIGATATAVALALVITLQGLGWPDSTQGHTRDGPTGSVTSSRTATPTSSAAPGARVVETAAARQGANTFTDPRTMVATGPDVPFLTVLDIECKLVAPTVPSVYYWYRITGPDQWRGLYTPANSYLNGDPAEGPYSQDPRNVNHSVPDCAPGE